MAKKLAAVPAQVVAAERARVEDIMTRDVVTSPGDVELERIFELMMERDLSRIPIVDAYERLIGIVSKTDLVREQFMNGDTTIDQRGAATGLHVHEVGPLARDVMTPVTLSVSASTSIAEATRLMLADNLHALPVTDEDRRVVGIVSAMDVLAWIAGTHLPPARDRSQRRNRPLTRR